MGVCRFPYLALMALGLVVVLAEPASATQLATGEGVAIPWMRLILGLLLCAMIAAISVIGLKRFMQTGGSVRGLLQTVLVAGTDVAKKRIHVHESRQVSAQAQVCLFECDGRDYLVVISQNQILALRPEDAHERQADVRLEAAE